jgi:ankyrin repeat protein
MRVGTLVLLLGQVWGASPTAFTSEDSNLFVSLRSLLLDSRIYSSSSILNYDRISMTEGGPVCLEKPCKDDGAGATRSDHALHIMSRSAENHESSNLLSSQTDGSGSLGTSPRERFVRARKMQMWDKTPSIVLAALFEDLDTTKSLIAEGEDVDSSDSMGSTGLMYSARSGNLDLAEVLVDAGASIDKRDLSGATALLYAAGNARTSVMNFLLSKGANPKIRTSEGGTLLHAAVTSGDETTVRGALATGQEINAQTSDGTTPLVLAAILRKLRALQILVESGADVNARRNDGMTVLIAATADHNAFKPADMKSVALLVERGADVNAQDLHGWTPLMGAAWYGGVDVVRFLIAHGADPSAVDDRGRTALSIAVQNNKSEIAECLRNGGLSQ